MRCAARAGSHVTNPRPWIARRRAELGLSQPAVSKHIGVGRPQVSHWETGKSTPHGDNLLRLAALLDRSPEWVLTGKEAAVALAPDGTLSVGGAGSTDAEALLAFVARRVGTARLAEELVDRDLVEASYRIARTEGFTAANVAELDRLRNRILSRCAK